MEAFPNSDPRCKILLSSSFSDPELVGHFADVEEGARDAKLDRRSPLSSLVRRPLTILSRVTVLEMYEKIRGCEAAFTCTDDVLKICLYGLPFNIEA